MKYLIVQRWGNTKGNHAGMEHMCDLLVEKYPGEYVKICKDCPPPHKKRDNRIVRKLLHRIDDYIYNREWVADYMKICQPMFDKLKSGDEVFLLEYNWPATSQYELACYVKKHYPNVKIVALSHITPIHYERNNLRGVIKKWSEKVDVLLTMGSGLTKYFISCGVPEKKISTGFHYVDNEYYHRNSQITQSNSNLTVLAVGCLQRDFGLLAEVVKSIKNIDWVICGGKKKSEVEAFFAGIENVEVKGFLQEDELRDLMESSDISINILEDTVGSNVITTSMAMGMAIVVSDVGSIRDHVSEENAILCDNTAESFISAIKTLGEQPHKVSAMKMSSVEKASKINVSYVNKWFSEL